MAQAAHLPTGPPPGLMSSPEALLSTQGPAGMSRSPNEELFHPHTSSRGLAGGSERGSLFPELAQLSVTDQKPATSASS